MVPLTLRSSSGINFLLKQIKFMILPHFQVSLETRVGNKDKVDLFLWSQLLGEVLNWTDEDKLEGSLQFNWWVFNFGEGSSDLLFEGANLVNEAKWVHWSACRICSGPCFEYSKKIFIWFKKIFKCPLYKNIWKKLLRLRTQVSKRNNYVYHSKILLF